MLLLIFDQLHGNAYVITWMCLFVIAYVRIVYVRACVYAIWIYLVVSCDCARACVCVVRVCDTVSQEVLDVSHFTAT